MKASTVVGLGALASACVVVGSLVFSIADMELRGHNERQAVRRALLGDCAGAATYAFRAGRIPYDAARFCPNLDGAQ
jgi:hypothetical protein